MQTTLKSRNLVLTEALKEYVPKKLARIQKYFDHLLSADVTLSTERGFHEVDVTLHANGAVFHAEEKTDDMYTSIDKVTDKLERQILKHKEKLKAHHHKSRNGSVSPIALMDENLTRHPLTRRKQTLSIVMPDEAIEEMESLGHHFYLFRNRNTEEINLVYRRENGTFGLVQPA